MRYFASLFLALLFPQLALATKIQCFSENNQVLYYSVGQVRMEAHFEAQSATFSDIALGITGSSNLGLRNGSSVGIQQNDKMRFELGTDAWCSYRLTLLKSSGAGFPALAFLDAFCENGTKSSVRLQCY